MTRLSHYPCVLDLVKLFKKLVSPHTSCQLFANLRAYLCDAKTSSEFHPITNISFGCTLTD